MMSGHVMVFHSDYHRYDDWKAALEAELSGLEVVRSTDIVDPLQPRYALTWKPPSLFYQRFRNLELVVNLGSGVDEIIGRTDTSSLPVTRISDPKMARMMASYVLFGVLRYARDIPEIEAAQRAGLWKYVYQRDTETMKVGVLGLGELGSRAAIELVRHGFDVRGWSRTPKSIPDVRCSAGLDVLDHFLSELDVLVVLLPLTDLTRGLLNAARLHHLKPGAKVINPARGAIFDEKALVDALQSGHLGGATLDTFEVEPLPSHSPLWAMTNVLITPHLASRPHPSSSARQIVENIHRIRRGESVLHRVDPSRGY